eukprot:snap_masked-scaffold_21-processed-gene-4.38-mRNA-1 protein AED:0.14 eAED:0.14 QI:0/-1/0/1/-1/1/1/0/465
MKKANQSVVELLDQAIKDDQVYRARDFLADAESILAGKKLPYSDSKAGVETYFTRNEPVLKNLRKNIDLVTDLLDSLNSEKDWTKVAERKGIKVFSQETPGDPLLQTKVETFFPESLERVPLLFNRMISLFNETDLLHKWFPRGLLTSAEMLLQVSNFSKIVNPKLVPKFPLSGVLGPREVTILGHGFDLSERSTVIITVSTLLPGDVVFGQDSELDFDVPEAGGKFTQFYLDAAYYFELRKEGAIFKMIQKINLNSKIIPPMIMNLVSKGALPYETISSFKKTLKNFEGSEWEERIEQNPNLYKEIERRLLNFMEKEFNFRIVKEKQAKKKSEDDLSQFSKSSRVRKLSSVVNLRRRVSSVKMKFGSRKKNKTRTLSRSARKSLSRIHEKKLYDAPVKGMKKWERARKEHEVKKQKATDEQPRTEALPQQVQSQNENQFWVLVSFIFAFFANIFQRFQKAIPSS